MHKRYAIRQGFTIVELLIVIAVIAILAAISIVAFTGIQNRAYDSAVKNDLANFVKKVQLIAAESGDIPIGAHVVASDGSGSGSRTGSPTPAPKLTVSKSAYPHAIGGGMANFIYCQGTGIQSGNSVWAIVARGKSGAVFRYSSVSGLGQSSPTLSAGVGQADCRGAEIGNPYSYSYGYSSNAGGWQSWLE